MNWSRNSLERLFKIKAPLLKTLKIKCLPGYGGSRVADCLRHLRPEFNANGPPLFPDLALLVVVLPFFYVDSYPGCRHKWRWEMERQISQLVSKRVLAGAWKLTLQEPVIKHKISTASWWRDELELVAVSQDDE